MSDDVDPFGRTKGEDSLKDMGWTVPTAGSTPTPVPMSSSAPTAAPPPPPVSNPLASSTVIRPRRRRGGYGWVRFIVPVAILGAIGIGVGTSVTGVKHAIDGVSIPNITFPAISVPTIPSVAPSTPTPAKPTAPPVGLGAGSLLRPAGLRAAVARLRPLGRLNDLRVAPDRINAQLVHGTALRITQFGSDGTITRNDVPTAGAALSTFPWARVNALAPSRMIRSAGRPASTVDYLVLIDFAGKPSWNLYFKDNTHYSAGADGRHAQRIG
jgi:hypothetical protein